MTLTMLFILISHHKGLALLLVVCIVLLYLAMKPLIKKLLENISA